MHDGEKPFKRRGTSLAGMVALHGALWGLLNGFSPSIVVLVVSLRKDYLIVRGSVPGGACIREGLSGSTWCWLTFGKNK